MSLNKIMRIDDNGLIDTNNQDMIRAYRNNLMVLTDEALQEKKISKFRIIREDDLFPFDSMWRVNSNETYLEYAPSNIAFAIRSRAAMQIIDSRRGYKTPFPVPPSKEEEREVLSQLDPRLGFVLEPVKFRSTKHFTINTALGYTGSYNQVSSGRNFVVIDTIDNFCNSGYAYSMDYSDAYLDVTHENLPISKSGIYLIHEDKYNELLNDSVMREQLAGKKVIRYRGDLPTAINMVLTQEGVLPRRVSGKDREYKPELEMIFDESMQELAFSSGTNYSLNHGNMDGRGGHFSDLLDGKNEDRYHFEQQLSDFVRKSIPEIGNMRFSIYRDINKIIDIVGYERIWSVLEKFNELQKKSIISRIHKYDMTHSVDSDTHNLFVETLKKIERAYQEDDVSFEMEEVIRRFFHGSTMEDKKNAALEINRMFESHKKIS